MILLSFGFSCFGFIFLSLSQKHHHKKISAQGSNFPYRPIASRIIGYSCIVFACALCILSYGAPIGITYWIGTAAAAGLLQTMFLTFWPQRIIWFGSASAALILIGGPMVILS